MPITIPRVASAPRAMLAGSARSAMSRDSRATIGSFMRRLLLPRRGRIRLFRGPLVVDANGRAVREILRDRAVASRDHHVALAKAAQDLDLLLALDAGRDLPRDGVALLDAEHDLDEAVAVRLVAGHGILALLPLLDELVDA